MAQEEPKRKDPLEIPEHRRQPVLVHLARKKGNEDGFPGIRLPGFEKIEQIGERILGEKNGCVGASEKPKTDPEHLPWDAADGDD